LFGFAASAVYSTAELWFDDHSHSDSHYWIFTVDPAPHHWDTLFVKGKELWHGAGSKADAVRRFKQVRKGTGYCATTRPPERSFLFDRRSVTRTRTPDPHDSAGKNLVETCARLKNCRGK